MRLIVGYKKYRSKKFVLVTALLALASLPLPSFAREGNFGLGAIIGAPTAITGKYYMNREEAIDGGFAYNSHDYVLFYGDYLRHFPGGFGHQSRFVSELVPYVGIGAVLALDTDSSRRNDKYFADANDDWGLGVRIPLGVEWISPKFPLGIALEIVPGLIVIPGTDSFVQGGIAFRYYF
jgi:hypothetical protein